MLLACSLGADGGTISPVGRIAILGAVLAALVAALVAVPLAGTADPEKRASASDIGQRIVTGMKGTHPSPALSRRVRRGEVGGVILFGWNVVSPARARRAIAALQSAASGGARPPLLIMTDQEGGSVRRFGSLPSTLSARRMGADPARAGREGSRTGRALSTVGVNVDLAPVADIPHFAGHFLGSRAFGRSAERVTTAAAAFAGGLRRAGVAATAKHFPGLGYARSNTDYGRVRITNREPALRADYRPFETLVRGATPLVMISNAAYRALDPSDRPACMSRRIVEGELRGVAGFEGVTISDALGSPAVTRVRNRYREIANAGVDMLLFGSERASRTAYRRLARAAHRHTLDPDRNGAAAERIRALKAALGD
jgi:beta-N-acetylhexosaminidase